MRYPQEGVRAGMPRLGIKIPLKGTDSTLASRLVVDFGLS